MLYEVITDQEAQSLLVGESYRFGSSHPSGINGLFGDGTVHYIPYSVDRVVFARMCHVSDGIPFQMP